MKTPHKMSYRTFVIIWVGQLVSLLGSGLTSFGLGVWVYQKTGSITAFALISLFATLPSIVLAPAAGALVDRWPKRRTLILSDACAGLSTLAIALLFMAGQLDIWHIYLAVGISSVCKAFQIPAYTSSITLLVSQEELGKVNGMVQGAQAVSQLFSPVLAGFLIGFVQLSGIILIDFATFLFAVLTLMLFAFPSESGATAVPPPKQQTSLWQEVREGWGYIAARPGMLGLLIAFAFSNFFTSMAAVLASPLILSFAPARTLGLALSIGGSGMLFGSIFMGVSGGPKRRITGILGFGFISGLALTAVGWQESAVLITAAAFVIFFNVAVVNSCNQTIWQSKVPLALQGRVFAVLYMITSSLQPLTFLVAGPLADRLFEPLMAVDGAWAASVGQIIGAGPGRGIGLMFILIGLLNNIVVLLGFLYPHIRRLEIELPDIAYEELPSEPLA